VRLLVAFTLGLPTSLIFPFSIMSTPDWWRPEIPLAIVLVAMLSSILSDPRVRERQIAGVRKGLSLGIAALLVAAVEVLAVLGAYQPPSHITVTSFLVGLLLYAAVALVPLVVGLVAAFAVGSGGTRRLALGTALASWLGAFVVNLIATLRDVSGPLTDVQSFELPVAVAGMILGFGIAALGGVLGWLLHRRLLGGADAHREVRP
jgi:hypothetical protein